VLPPLFFFGSLSCMMRVGFQIDLFGHPPPRKRVQDGPLKPFLDKFLLVDNYGIEAAMIGALRGQTNEPCSMLRIARREAAPFPPMACWIKKQPPIMQQMQTETKTPACMPPPHQLGLGLQRRLPFSWQSRSALSSRTRLEPKEVGP
jgi:hypothetical protein